jgi:hypothetical protein
MDVKTIKQQYNKTMKTTIQQNNETTSNETKSNIKQM